MAVDRFFNDVATFGVITDADSLFVQTGGQPMVTNVDQSGLAAGGLTEFHVAPAMNGSIGTEALPFKAELATGKGLVTNAGGNGEFYLQADSTAGTNVIQNLRIIGDMIQRLVGGGTFEKVMISSSQLFVIEAVTIEELRVSGRGDVFLFNEGSATRPLLVDINGSRSKLLSERGVNGPVVQTEGVATWDALSEAIASYDLSVGTCHLVSSGTIPAFEWRSGMLNVDGLSKPTTITVLNVWPDVDDGDLQRVLSNTLLTTTVVHR